MLDQALENLEQHGDVIEMESSGRFVEDEQIAACDVAITWTLSSGFGFGQMPHQF